MTLTLLASYAHPGAAATAADFDAAVRDALALDDKTPTVTIRFDGERYLIGRDGSMHVVGGDA